MPFTRIFRKLVARHILLASSMLLLAAVYTSSGFAQQQAGTQASPSAQLPSFAPLIEEHGAAVVNISTTRVLGGQSAALPFPEGDPFFEFFRRFLPPPAQGERQAHGLGSGFIIHEDGYILTNAHVVTETDEVSVKLVDKREFKAKILGADPYTDIALLKIDAAGLPTVKIGTPESLRPGDWVAAIGAPFGFENSITAGIVSAKGRMLPNETYVPFIQTDVAVNPGNSGGPLFNMRGEVVGINSMIYSGTGGFMGLSFAIPINIAMDIAKELRATGKVTRSRIGVQVQELTRELAASFGLKEPSGALIARVEEGGPAEKAGLRPGDIVLSLNGQKIVTSADLARLVAATKPGTTVTMQVWRKGKTVPVEVTTVEMTPPQAPGADAGRSSARAGLVVGEIPDEQRRALGLDHGVLVHDVEGPAARAGIRPGDIIRTLNDTPIENVEQLEKLIAENAGKTVALLVQRGGDTVFVPLKIGTDE